MDQEERQKKLEAGRAKLARFRQRKTKGQGALPPKKTAKRKGAAVHQNLLPRQGCALAAQAGPSENGPEPDDGNNEAEELLKSDVDQDSLEGQQDGELSLLGDEATADVSEDVEDLRELLETHTGNNQLQELQSAVQKRNEIISQLSANLQAALESREQVQLEALQLTDQIQALQNQLHQAGAVLRSRTNCSVQDQLKMAYLQGSPQGQRSLPDDHQRQMGDGWQKEMAITDLKQRLAVAEAALSQLQDALSLRDQEVAELREGAASRCDGAPDTLLLQRLTSELEAERETSQREGERAARLQQLVQDFESERRETTERLAQLQVELDRAQTRAREAQQYKAEKEELNGEVVRLGSLVQSLQNRLQEEEEASHDLKAQCETDRSNCELRLQMLEEEKECNLAQMAETHEAALKRLRAEHVNEVQRLQKQLEAWQKCRDSSCQSSAEELAGSLVIEASECCMTHESLAEREEESPLDVSSSDQDYLMEKYIATAAPPDRSWLEASLEEHSLLEQAGNYRFELDLEIGLKSKFTGSAQDDTEQVENLTDVSFPSGNGSSLAPEHGVESQLSAQWREHATAVHDLNESLESVDLAKALLMQQCKDLTEQLEERDKQLEVLQDEVQRSSEELQEALEKWSKLTTTLESVQWELESEREQRQRCEEIISRKTHEEDNLKNKLSFLESQQETRQDRLVPLETEDLIKELRDEKELLLNQLREQERLVRDVQEQKLAGDSVTSEVQALFGRQLTAIQVQRDQLQAQLEAQKAKNQTTVELLGQKTLDVDSSRRELEDLRTELEEQEEKLQAASKEKTVLEARLFCLAQNLANAEEALSQGAEKKAVLERRLGELEVQAKNLENILESERGEFQNQLKVKKVDVERLESEREKVEVEHMEKESALERELADVRRALEDQDQAHARAVQSLLESEAEKLHRALWEAEGQLKRSHQEEMCKLEEKHQEVVNQLHAETERRLSEVKAVLEEEQKKQIGMIKQVHERERQREMAALTSRLRSELSAELGDDAEAAHQAELLQAQTQHALELEALRLSLNNLHMAQLELSQSNLQRDKEAALSELQASLRAKWAQESAMLQTRQQFELEKVLEQSRAQAQRHQQDMDELNRVWETKLSELKMKMEKEQANKMEALRAEWLEESEQTQAGLQTSLLETQEILSVTRKQLEDLQISTDRELQRLEGDLSQAWSDRDAAARAVEDLVVGHKAVLQERQEHAQHLEELANTSAEKGRELQQQLEKLQTEHAALKTSSEQEAAHLWSQLECMRASRQELGELKEQLLARSSRVEDIERLKQEFSQQRRDIQEHNEMELENLRTYFEQRLRTTEEGYREEIALLQLRLVEGALEESILKTGDASFLSEGKADEEKNDLLAEITLRLEKHKEDLDALRLQLEERHKQELEHLRSCMALSYREELLQVKTDLTDRYFNEIQDLKTKHALELEQLRAKLSDNHVKEISRLRLQSAQDAARQVEQELEERGKLQAQEHQARLAQVRSEETQMAALTKEHAEELKRVDERHRELLRQAEEKLKQGFAEELRVKVEEARIEEREKAGLEFSQQREEVTARLREELLAQAEERLSTLRAECEGLRLQLEERQEQLDVERGRLRALQDSLENQQGPQASAMRQSIEAQFQSELQMAKCTMATEVKDLHALLQEQSEAKLLEARSRFEEEQKQLEEKFTRQQESALSDVRENHSRELAAQKALLEQLEAEHQHLEDRLRQGHRAELEALQAVLQETNLAQLEAQEAELQARHRQEKDEQEARMLTNMDTLEATYLSEIQSIRDERERALGEAGERHAAELERLRSEHRAQLSGVSEELRREMAQAHMDKFTAMAAELGQAHKEELSAALRSQQRSMEEEHGRALEALRQEVLALERQHDGALQELRGLHDAEVRQQEEQLETLKVQHQQQLQELSTTSAQELEVLRRELEEAALSRQSQMDLLKAQSAELLEKRVAQLQEEFDRQRADALEQERRKLSEEHACKERSSGEEVQRLTRQLQEQEAAFSKLSAETSSLRMALEGKSSELDTLETLLQRRERESQEGANLVTMLRADLTAATEEREGLQEAHARLLKVLLEVARTTVATEDLISRRVGACVESGQASQATVAPQGSRDLQDKEECEDRDSGPDCSLWSALTDEGLELSQRLAESLFSGPELEPEGEGMVLDALARLRSAVDKLLELVSESTRQLQHTHGVQAHLEEQFSQGRDDAAQLILQHQQLLEQLDAEAGAKNQLELELHKAEGLMEGYVAEKAALEEALQQKETREQLLAEELEVLRGQLQELSEEHTLLLRQREAFTGGFGEAEKALLEEADRLAQEKLDVQRQAEKDRSGLASHLKLLEGEMEEQESRVQQLEEQRRAQVEDLQQQIQALEKQLKHNRHFIDDQAVEREHERDEFQQEIKKLEALLRQPAKPHAGVDHKGRRIEDLVLQVESLQAAMKDKMEDYNTLLMAKEQYQHDVAEQNEEIDKMAGRIRELEQALLSSAESSRALGQLEQELQKARKAEKDLLQDKEALQQQQYANRMQISALQSKLDETRHRFSESGPDPTVREQWEDAQQDLLNKEKQVEMLMEQLEEVQRDLAVKSEEVLQLNLQLELRTKQNSIGVSQLESEISSLKEQVNTLNLRLGSEIDESQFPLALLNEKNQEIDHLNQEILQLQQEVQASKDNKDVANKQAEVEELRSRVEHLRSDQDRLRHDKEEEVEQLHEVIHKLQEELAQLGPNRHEVSDSQEHSPEPHDFWPPAAQKDSLCHELTSQTLRCSRARLQEMQGLLELAASEKEAVQRLLHSQEETFRNQVEALGRSLREERHRLGQLEEEGDALKLQLSQRQAQVERLTGCVQNLEEEGRERQALLQATEVQREELAEELKSREENAVAVESLRATVKELEAQVFNLETVKKELFAEGQSLRRQEGRLQEEIEKLKREVTSNVAHIQELNLQLEERVANHAETQKEVLTCAEETLAKAERALRQKEEQLAQLGAEHRALRAELAAVKEGLSSSTERAEKLLEEGQTKDKALANLEILNQHLKTELQGLQADLTVQEEELTYQQRELEQLRERYTLRGLGQAPDGDPRLGFQHKRPGDYLPSLSCEGSPCSPEVLRKMDYSEEQGAALHASRLSEFSAMHSTSIDLHIKASPLDPTRTRSPGSISASEKLSAVDSLDSDKVKELEHQDMTPPSSPAGSASTLSAPDWASDGYGSNVSSELGARLRLELEATERLDTNFIEYLRHRGMAPADPADGAAESVCQGDELLSPELQGLLRRVYQEGCKVLALSQRPAPATGAPPPTWQREKRALQDTVLSLRELLCKMADREHKTDGEEAGWRSDLLQAVRDAFASERGWLCAQLQSVVSSQGLLDSTAVVDKMEQLFKQQEKHQHQWMEKLVAASRRGLLVEVQDLQSQLRDSSLQSRERLHQLQEEGSQGQIQLRRQVALLEERLQQEQALVEDLRTSLTEEQTRAAEQSAQLRAERDAVAELREAREQSSKTQQELQNQVHKLRTRLESEEAERQACEEAVGREQNRVQELQEELEQERRLSRCRHQEEQQSHEILRQSLKECSAQSSQLGGALEQERVVSSNLRRELQIEQSRCEALISQERARTSDVLRELDELRARNDQLTSALAREKEDYALKLDELHARDDQLTSALAREKEDHAQKLKEERSRYTQLADTLSREQDRSRRLEEEAQQHAEGGKFLQELQAQLEQERRQGEELAATAARLQQQALHAQRQLEAERERESGSQLRATMDGLQTQRREVSRSLEAERQRAAQLQAELDALREKLLAVRDRERQQEEQRERLRRHERQEQAERERLHERTNEKLSELEMQRHQDQQRLQQLQQTLANLDEQERQLTSRHRQQGGALLRNPHQLLIAQQQLQLACAKLGGFLHKARDRRDGPTQSEERDMQDLVRTLTNLDRDLKQLGSQRTQSTTSSSSSSGLVERLFGENADLTARVAALSEDKVSLKHSLSCLERELQVQRQARPAREQVKSPEPVDAAQLSEKLAWQKERTTLHTALRKANTELSRVTAEIENRPVADGSSGYKMQRLYGKYLRAESFRKALVYQKKYLLLLLGGFQDCEQATLSLIARMGAYPSPGDLQASAPRSRPINRFRTSVRVVIAISRLRFLVRKWQKAIRKGPVVAAAVNGHGHSSGSHVRTEVLRQHPGIIYNSPPTRDMSLSQRDTVSPLVPPIKSPFRLHDRVYTSPALMSAERSVTPSQNAERSLTEYIQHLETIQQRLGGAVSPGSPTAFSYPRKSDR